MFYLFVEHNYYTSKCFVLKNNIFYNFAKHMQPWKDVNIPYKSKKLKFKITKQYQ